MCRLTHDNTPSSKNLGKKQTNTDTCTHVFQNATKQWVALFDARIIETKSIKKLSTKQVLSRQWKSEMLQNELNGLMGCPRPRSKEEASSYSLFIN